LGQGERGEKGISQPPSRFTPREKKVSIWGAGQERNWGKNGEGQRRPSATKKAWLGVLMEFPTSQKGKGGADRQGPRGKV